MYKADHERYTFAEQLYCHTDKKMDEIAKLSKIPLRSLYQRARDYKWDTLRRASRRSPMVLCEEMYRELSDLTATINSRPEGQRIPTPAEADLRRKIVYTIAKVKNFPTHAEAAFLMQSLIRYGTHFHYTEVQGLQTLVDSFLSHRDVYGFASYQPEHNQETAMLNDQELEKETNGVDTPDYRHPDDTTEELNKDIFKWRAPTFDTHPEIITKFKTQKESYYTSLKSSPDESVPENKNILSQNPDTLNASTGNAFS